MKKYILLFTLISVILLSCKKDQTAKPPGQDGKLYPISFSLSAFTQTEEPVTTATTGKRAAADVPVSYPFTRIGYRLYTPAGVFIKNTLITELKTNTIPIKDSLPAGDYTAVFLGYSSPMGEAVIANNGPDDMLYYFSRSGTSFQTIIFYKKINFTVSATGNISQNIVLQRVTSALQLVVKDAIPASVKSISVTYEDYNGFKIFKNTVVPNTPSPDDDYVTYIDHAFNTNVPTDKIGTTNFTTGEWPYILNTVTPITVTITAYDKPKEFTGTFGVIAKKIIPDVMFYRNTKTILSGKLFELGTNGFQTSFKGFEADSITKSF